MNKIIYSIVCFQALLFSSLHANQDEPVSSSDQGLMQTVIMISTALLFFYFILWRPEQKRRKEMEVQRSSLKKGDKVTAMGIIGTVVRVQEHSVILKMYDGSKIEVVKGAITDVAAGSEEDVKKTEKEDKKTEKAEKENQE